MRSCGVVILMVLTVGILPVSAQRPITLSEAITIAQARSPRIAIARADSASAQAQVRIARAFPNPDLILGYSRDPPRYHLELNQSLEFPWLRSARVRAAAALERAAHYAVEAERWSVRYDVELAYVHAAALRAVHRLSERNARGGEELLRIAREREAAGDASQLDIHLAAVAAAQAAVDALTDSIDAITAVFELQVLLGMDTTRVVITPSDSLIVPIVAVPARVRPLRVSVAELQVQSEQANVLLARRGVIAAPALRIGFDTHDPGGQGDQILPTWGLTISLPIWNRKRGDIALARATAMRAEAQLRQMRLETRTARVEAEKQREIVQMKVERGDEIVRNAEAVVSLTVTAYREGAMSLPDVLQARRTARDAIRAYILNLEAVRVAEAAVIRAQIVGGSVTGTAPTPPRTGTAGKTSGGSAP